ncbi:hypothetical protein ACMFMG_006095 [Clarireedia jacksonii]
MSDLTEILIEKLQLQRLLCERVFIKWEDQSGESCTLGSRTEINKKDLKFLMAAYCDKEGYIHIHFSLKVSIVRDGKKYETEMLLVVPPDADFSKALTPCSISTIDDLSRLDASAVHDAGISDSVHIIYIPFDLITEGFVVRKTTSALKPKPWNRTSRELIRRFVSLSNTKTFTVYITPNDYARVNLKGLYDRLNKTSTTTKTRTNNIKEMYIQQDAVLVEWSILDPELPLQYTENPQPLPEVQVSRLPPIIFEQETLSINTIETAIADTPARIPATPSSISVYGIFSPICEESSDSEVDWDDIEETWRNIEEASRNIEIDFDIDSDQERLANLNFRDLSQQFNSQELSQQFNCDSEVSKILESKFTEWMETAGQINPNIHEHKRLITKLLILGNCIRTSNSGVFDATILWCSTIFFYDPFDSDISLELWKEGNLWLLSDIAQLIKWANKVHYSAEMNPLLVDHFLKLGDTARTIALHPEYTHDSYKRQKRVCTTQVIIKLGKPVISISRENSKPVSRKHLGTDSNTSKRVKI